MLSDTWQWKTIRYWYLISIYIALRLQIHITKMMKSTLFPCRFCSLGNTTCPSGWHLWRCNSPWYGPSKELLIKVYVRKKQEKKKKKQHLTQNTWLLVSSFNRSSDWEDTQGSVLGGGWKVVVVCFCTPVDIRLCLKFGMACVPQLQSFSFTDSQQGSYYLLPRSESGRKNVLFTHLVSSRHTSCSNVFRVI